MLSALRDIQRQQLHLGSDDSAPSLARRNAQILRPRARLKPARSRSDTISANLRRSTILLLLKNRCEEVSSHRLGITICWPTAIRSVNRLPCGRGKSSPKPERHRLAHVHED